MKFVPVIHSKYVHRWCFSSIFFDTHFCNQSKIFHVHMMSYTMFSQSKFSIVFFKALLAIHEVEYCSTLLNKKPGKNFNTPDLSVNIIVSLSKTLRKENLIKVVLQGFESKSITTPILLSKSSAVIVIFLAFPSKGQ